MDGYEPRRFDYPTDIDNINNIKQKKVKYIIGLYRDILTQMSYGDYIHCIYDPIINVDVKITSVWRFDTFQEAYQFIGTDMFNSDFSDHEGAIRNLSTEIYSAADIKNFGVLIIGIEPSDKIEK